MALPDGVAQPRRRQPSAFGVAIEVVAGDAVFDIEILRAPDSTGTPSTGSARVVATVRGYTELWFDYLPNDGVFRHYLARHVLAGYTDGPDTSWLRAKPAELQERTRP